MQKSANHFALGLIIVVALWLITRVVVVWAPTAGWVNNLIGIGFFAAVIGSVVFLLRMAKNIGKSG